MKKTSYTGLGLIFGTGLGALVSILMSKDILWALVGTGAGLIIGSIVDANLNKK